MLEACLIFAVALLPGLFSLLLVRQAEAHSRQRLQSALHASNQRQLDRSRLPFDRHDVEGVNDLVGDITCRFNARSAHLRCAVNPFGPCRNCPHYESIAFND